MTEVRQKKLKELQEYTSKPADDRARDIMHLLGQMKPPKKDQVLPDKEEDQIKYFLTQP